MNDSNEILSRLKSRLPEAWHDAVDELAVRTLQAAAPLRLTLVGGFSVGKSSLLNMLLGEALLFTAKEEATALPTFIEYGTVRSMTLIRQDGTTLPLELNDFQQVTTHAPEGAACATLALPLPWLQDVVIVDLPGLGSVSAVHQEYTLAQIQQADAILYLIEPRGPTQSDLETIALIRQYGKRIKLAVTRWDEVEAAVARGEKEPNLEQWTVQIAEKTGLKTRLSTVHYQGMGQEEILDFVVRAKEDLSAIRLNRFDAELLPALQNALGTNAAEQAACEARSDEAIRDFHSALLQSKQALTQFKAQLYEQQQQDQQRIEQENIKSIDLIRSPLLQALQSNVAQLQDEAEWEHFGLTGANQLCIALTTLAEALSQKSTQYGELQLPEVGVEQFNLRLPAPETVDSSDFLAVGKLNQLQHDLEAKQLDFAAKQAQLHSLPEVDIETDEHALRELRQQQKHIELTPLSRIIQRTEGSGLGSIGRTIGEIADLALIFVNPTTVASKAASVIGKGAKVVNLAVNTKKMASTIRTGVKIAQSAKNGAAYKNVPSPIMQKLGMLEVLSLGYWGERLGNTLGGGPTEEEIIDPEARAEQEQAMAQVSATIQTLRRELVRKEDIANERALTGWALEQSQQEQVRLQAEIQRLMQKEGQRQRELQQTLLAERKHIVQHHAERAVAQWLRSYEQQSTSMASLLQTRVQQYWENYVKATLNARVIEVDELMVLSQTSVQDKTVMLSQLREDAMALQSVIGELQ